MKKRKATRLLSRLLVFAMALVIAMGAASTSSVGATSYDASFIDRLNGLIDTGYKDYLDSSVMYQLPENVRDDQDISVIVKLDMDDLFELYSHTDKSMTFGEFALEGDRMEKAVGAVSEKKNEVLSALDEKGVAYSVGETYTAVLSGFELVIKARDFAATCGVLPKGARAIVSEEYKVAETQLVENTVNVYDTGIFNSSDVSYDGSGMVVAVLDTGLDYNHSAFSPANFTSTTLGLTYDMVAQLVDSTTAAGLAAGLTVDDVYINNKVPFGFDYADKDSDPYSTHNNHGTHVSGVIVGKDDTITGVAPNAQLVSMKIFSDVMDTARSSWILSALEDCVILGVDVINMSLGTSCGFSRESDEELVNGVYQKIREAGISLIVAASNSYSSAYGSEANGNLGLTSNPDTGTVGSPSTYAGAMSVASINGVETPYIKYGEKIIYFTESTNGASEENHFVEALLGSENAKDIEFVVIPGVGRSADYTGLDVKGKIALVRRGSNTFEEKAIIAQAQGAAGIIIYNNVSGDIKMNVGDAKIAVCSISQDDGEALAALGGGTVAISKEQTSGPFMSYFSSWGPTPSLGIKPEITAHGGNILSAVTGGGYDRLSGTSMACPNLSGFAILLRQYVVENFPDIANDNVKVSALVNCLMMSTADIVYNKNGLPYAVRKQGAGLANLLSAIKTKAYVITYDAEGKEMDKTKLELGDDAEKRGVYEMKFTIKNFGSEALSYDLSVIAITEGVSDTKTNAGETTVDEQGYVLSGATTTIDSVENGQLSGTTVTVDGGKSATVKLTLTLSDEDKKYLDESFANGMYVEGFVKLDCTAEGGVDLVIPFLTFYGDWTKAPMLDRDYYETNADELDDSIPVEDKTLPDAYATRPVGGVSDDYVSYLGSYYFTQDPSDMIISASRDYIALSNQVGTVHSLRFVWAGMLRSAAKVVITITDDTTGEVVFETVDYDVRKSYGDGGSIYPANIEIEFDTMDYNLANNSEYTVRLVGYLDYGNGALETNEKNVFEFPLVVDFEAPTLEDVEFYYEYDKALGKNRLYAKFAVYDNHYSMAMQLGYVTTATDAEGNASVEMKSFEQYLTPIYSVRNGTTYVTCELTDYIYEIKDGAYRDNTFVVTCYDYALNYATYEVGLPTDYIDFYFDGLEEGLTLNPNEVYALAPLIYPDSEWSELLVFSSSRPAVARVVNNKLIAVAEGKTVIKAAVKGTDKSVTFNLTVRGEGDEGYVKYDKPVADIFRLTGYETLKAYYIVNNDDKDIGDTGNVRFFEGKFNLSMFPSESVRLNYDLDAYFPSDTTVAFESSNDSIVSIDELGVVTARAEGFASVTMKVLLDGKSTYYSETVTVEVKDPYLTTGPSLTHYYGNGGTVSVPSRLSLTDIGSFAFSNFEYVLKTPDEMAFDDAETSKAWYIGDNTITKVILPEGIKKINSYAFANLTALEEVVLPSTLESIEYGAFYGCTALKKITFSGENNLKIINQNAFENCALEGTIDLPEICIISDYAFAGNTKLVGVTTSKTLQSVGQYAFAGCKSLKSVTIVADKVKYGAYAFTGCESLTSFEVRSAVIPAGMFYECEALTSITIGAEVNLIGEYAFRRTAVATFDVAAGNKTYKVQKASYVISADGKQLVAVAPALTSITAADMGGVAVTTVARGALSHCTKLKTAVLPSVTYVSDYGFASCERLESVTLGTLTNIGDYAFFDTAITALPAFTADARLGKYAFAKTDLTSVSVPDGAVLPEGIFSECEKLASVTIGDGVTVGKYAFNFSKEFGAKIESFTLDGEKLFRYTYFSPLTSLTIGKNAKILENAFAGHASIESITLGEGADIGYMAFYNTTSLKSIDLSGAVKIGDYAFSGDVLYVCYDSGMSIPAVTKNGTIRYTYHAPALESVTLSAAESIGEHSFSYCRSLVNVTLGDKITSIPAHAFMGCIVIENINLGNITFVGENAFAESGIKRVELPKATEIDKFAFVYCARLEAVVLGGEDITVGEGAFAYCDKLSRLDGEERIKTLGDYAFAYSLITEADLSGAESIGRGAFAKEEKTPFTVVLGEKLTELGDNPFALCVLSPFSTEQKVTFNGKDYITPCYTYDISDSVSVIDGSLYCKTANGGLELITYAGIDNADAKVATGTVRISSLAFAGSDVAMVTLPYTVGSIGHKAFYLCDSLKMVVFESYRAPILEEEFDARYYESFAHVPGSGDYGNYTDYEGNEVPITGMGLVPYFMWNVTDGMYNNIFYGASFVDYVGYVDNKLVMVRPTNGEYYGSYVMSQYFGISLDGAAAADKVTLAAIAAIDAIPERVSYDQKAVVEAARAAYDKIATLEQQALVTNYQKLVSAEQRIKALAPTEDAPAVDGDGEAVSPAMTFILLGAGLVLSIGLIALLALILSPKKKKEDKTDGGEGNAPTEPAEAEEKAETEE